MVEEQVNNVEEQAGDPAVEPGGGTERVPLIDAARRVLLAGIGAVALAQDEVEDFVDKLVDRGEIAEKDGRRLVGDVLERRKKQTKKAESVLDRRVEEILGRMNVPTKADIDGLSAQIAALSAKIDDLKRARE
jgi:poly(hydroxyalkanoate) granule-associated protein